MAAVAAVPALWVLIQVLPLGAIAHPIWTSLETALGRPVTGSISIDPGASVIALGQYLSLAAIGFVSAAVAVDRHRAEWILFALTGATAAIALILLLHGLFYSGGDFVAVSACAGNRLRRYRSSRCRCGLRPDAGTVRDTPRGPIPIIAGPVAQFCGLERGARDLCRGLGSCRNSRGGFRDRMRHRRIRVYDAHSPIWIRGMGRNGLSQRW